MSLDSSSNFNFYHFQLLQHDMGHISTKFCSAVDVELNLVLERFLGKEWVYKFVFITEDLRLLVMLFMNIWIS